jgi:hypothetical protein
MTENVATRQGSETTTTDPPTNCSTSVAYGFESFPGAQVHSLESNHHDTPFPPPFSLPNNQLVSCRLVLPIVHTAYGRNGTNRCTREPNRLPRRPNHWTSRLRAGQRTRRQPRTTLSETTPPSFVSTIYFDVFKSKSHPTLRRAPTLTPEYSSCYGSFHGAERHSNISQ